MPVYQYDGKHYSLPDGLTDEQAIAKIKGHLGESPSTKSNIGTRADLGNGFVEGAKGTAAAVGDIAQGLWKIPAAAAFTTVGKLAAPEISTQKHWESANAALDEHFPSFASNPDNIGYKAPMYPFEKYGEGLNYIAKKASGGNEDIEGAINVGGNFLPIPFAGKAAKGVKKVFETIDPALRPNKQMPTVADPVLNRIDQQLAPKPEVAPEAPMVQPNPDAMLSTRNQALFEQGRKEFTDFIRQDAAQQAIEARQREMEQQVARQTSLDMNAAERARQEQAPTGYADWVEQQRRAAEQRQPGNNTPIDFESTYPVRAADYPDVLRDASKPYEGGIDYPTAEQKALPVTVADMINGDRRVPSGVEINPMDRAAQILSGTELARKRPAKDAPRRGGKQSGAIDLKTLEEGFEKLKTLPNGTKLKAHADGDGALHVSAFDKDGNFIGRVSASSENWANPKVTDNLKADWSESRQKGTATEMYRFLSELGNDVVPSKSQTTAGKGMWDGFERKGLSSNGKISRQSGKLDFKQVAGDLEKTVKAVGNSIGKAMSSRTDADKVLGMAIRDDSFVAKPMNGESIVAKALQEDPTKFGKFSDNLQSGAVSAGDKFNSTVLQQAGRWMNWASSMTKKLTRERVVPVEREFSRLKDVDLQHAMQIAMKEDAANTRLSPEQLRDAGVSDKAISALGTLRKAMDEAFDRIHSTNKELNLPEVSRREAYFSSQFSGDYKIPVISKDGKRVLGFATAHSMGEAKKALAWIEKNMPDAQAKIVDRRDSPMGRAPKDVTNLYQTLMDVFKDTPMGAEMQQLMERNKEVQGYAERGFWQHFQEKSGVRFFIGDRPWLDAKENATQAAQSQVRYLKDVYNWIPTQEMMAEMKKVVGNKELVEKQPDTVRMANAYLDSYLGVSKNKWHMIEDSVAQAMGLSTGRVRSALGGMKTMTYWMQLGFSGGYMVATPLQMLIHVPGFHLQLSQQGSSHSIMNNMYKTLRDSNYAFQIDLGHKLGDAVGKELNWSKADREFANAAIRYMEDNGVNNKSLRDEYASLGSHPLMDTVGKVVDKTITGPDYASRTVAFFTFAHHLKDGNPSMPQVEVFRKAAELTDKSAVPLERHNRPLMFDKMGMVGEMTSMYKAPVFQYWNNMYEHAAMGKKTGNWNPLMSVLLAGTLLGGVNGIGGFSEMDSLVEVLKDINAKIGSKSAAVALKDFSPKTMALTHLGEFGTYGTLSAVTNTAMSSRFSPQGFDFQKPWNVASPIIQEGVEWASGGKALARNAESFMDHGHGDLPSVQQAAYDALSPPAVKGLMENNLDNFHGKQQPNGRTPVYKASDIRDKEVMYNRTPGDQMRRNFGLYSLEESKTKEMAARVNQNNQRMKTVRDRLGKDIASEILSGDNPKSNIELFVKAGGEMQELDTVLQQRLAASQLNPQQREMLRARTLRDVQAIMDKQKLGVRYAN